MAARRGRSSSTPKWVTSGCSSCTTSPGCPLRHSPCQSQSLLQLTHETKGLAVPLSYQQGVYEVDLWVGPLLDAIEASLGYGDIFGPLMMLAVKNDESNLRKAHKAWEKILEVEPEHEVATLRGLLEREKSSGIHKPGAVLCDPSAAIALLWMRRTLQFLGQCLSGVLDDAELRALGASYAEFGKAVDDVLTPAEQLPFLRRLNVLSFKLQRARSFLSLHSFHTAQHYLLSTWHDLRAMRATLVEAGAALRASDVCG